MKNNLSKNFLYSFIYEVLTVLTPLIITPYVSRILGVELIGIRSLTYAILSYFEIFATLGIAVYGQKEIAKYSHDIKKRSKIFLNLLIIKTITFSIVFLAYSFLFFQINFMPEYKYLWVLWLIHLFEQLFNITWFFEGIENFKLLAMRGAIIRLLQIILTFIFVKTPNDFQNYIILYAGTPLLQAISIWPMLFNKIVIVKNFTQEIWIHFKNIINYFIPTIATVIYSNIDKVMISAITRDSRMVGLYDSAQSIALLSTTIFSSVFKVIRSRMSNQLDKIDQKHKKLFQEITFFVISSISFGVFSLSNTFVKIFFGQQYEDAGILLKLFSIMIYVMGVSQYISAIYIVPFGKQKLVNKYYILAIIVNIITNIIFINLIGTSGAVIGSILAEGSILCGMLKIYHTSKQNKISLSLLIKNILSGIIMSILCGVIEIILPQHNLHTLLLNAILGATTYIISLQLMHYPIINKILNLLKNKE